MNRRYMALGILGLIAFASAGAAQSRETEHTLRSSPTEPRPKATLQDVIWLQGVWEGVAFGGISEEIWSEPLANTMMGVYRSVQNGAIKFYEINSIVETKGSLEMRLKHFNDDLSGWEEQKTVRVFPLVKVTDSEIYFDGMTYKKTGKDSITVYLAIGDKEKGEREVVFEYRRKQL